MRIGIQLGMHGHSGTQEHPAPGWQNMLEQVRVAEEAGFDIVVLEDALLEGGMGTHGFWEAASLAGAVAAASSTIRIGHSMINPPLRSPTVIAKMASTLDEISGGRYSLGLGAGNTPDDYDSFGVPADHRYSRAVETVEIVRAMLKEGSVDFEGRFHSASGALEPKGPSPGGPPIVVGALGPKMIRLAARSADGWNGWSPEPQTLDAFRPLTDEVDRACLEVDRDPSTLDRSLDVAVDPHRLLDEPATGMTPYLISGDAGEIADRLIGLGQLGIDEVRIMVWPDRPPEQRPEIVAALAEVVDEVHRG